MTDINLLFRSLIAIGAIVGIAETLASLFWLTLYYRYGIRLGHRDVVGTLQTNRSLTDILACSNTGFRFRSISANEAAFRDPLIRFLFPAPVMHGSIRYSGSKIEVQELANWTPLYVVFLFLTFSAFGILIMGFVGSIGLVVSGIALASWVLSYRSQRRRLDDLVDELVANLSEFATAGSVRASVESKL
jgi:nitrate reductase NapE component